jgi:hypothetical protein
VVNKEYTIATETISNYYENVDFKQYFNVSYDEFDYLIRIPGKTGMKPGDELEFLTYITIKYERTNGETAHFLPCDP